MREKKKKCAYCGVAGVHLTRDHVVPRGLYPPEWEAGKIQVITVPACVSCNNEFSSDEPHFRTMLLLAGEPNDQVRKLWEAKAAPSFYNSFYKMDGEKRVRALFDQIRPAFVEGQRRFKIYPANDQAVLRIIKKVVRGLSHYHDLESAVQESRVWADVLRFPIQGGFEDLYHHRDPRIFLYFFDYCNDGEISSVWQLTFFENKKFIATVSAEPS